MPLSNYIANNSNGLIDLLNKYIKSSSSKYPIQGQGDLMGVKGDLLGGNRDFENQFSRPNSNTFKYPIQGQGDLLGMGGNMDWTSLLKSLLGQGSQWA